VSREAALDIARAHAPVDKALQALRKQAGIAHDPHLEMRAVDLPVGLKVRCVIDFSLYAPSAFLQNLGATCFMVSNFTETRSERTISFHLRIHFSRCARC
jgi:hypothetical protein